MDYSTLPDDELEALVEEHIELLSTAITPDGNPLWTAQVAASLTEYLSRLLQKLKDK